MKLWDSVTAWIRSKTVDKLHTVFSSNFYGMLIDSDFEYFMNMVAEECFAVFLTIGNIAIELFTVSSTAAIELSRALVLSDLNTFGKDLRAAHLTQCPSQQIKKLLTILREIQRSNEWIIEFNNHCYIFYLTPPLAFTYAIGLGVLCQYFVSSKLE